MPKFVTGGINGPYNRQTLDWCYGNYLAFACHNHVVIIDGKSADQVKTLHGHKAPVHKIRFATEDAPLEEKSPTVPLPRPLRLASCDLNGVIIVWNALLGFAVAEFCDKLCPFVAEMFWLPWADVGCEFLLALHWPSSLSDKNNANSACFTLWNAQLGTKIWQKIFANVAEPQWPFTFALDPFHVNNLAYLTRGQGHLTLIDNVSFSKPPTLENFRQFAISSSEGSARRFQESRHTPPSTSLASSIVRTPIIKAIAAAADRSSRLIENGIAADGSPTSTSNHHCNLSSDYFKAPFDQSFVQMIYHKAVKNVLILVNQTSIIFVDPTDDARVISQIAFDKCASPICQLIPCSMRDAFYSIQENGSITLRVMKLKPLTKADQTKDTAENEISYELAANTESFRITKSCQISSLALSPLSEINLCMLSTNGKLTFYDLSPSSLPTAFQIICDGRSDETLLNYARRDEKIGQTLTKKVKFSVKCTTTPLAQKPTTLKLCPEPAGPGRQYVAVGNFDGSIQIVDIFANDIERHFCVHNCPIICLEWISSDGLVSAASTKVSCANVNSAPSLTPLSKAENSMSSVFGPYRNEIVLTNVKTGFSRALRRNDDLVDDFSIKMVRVSYFGTFLAVTFDGRQPMEIWDLKSARLLRRMARTCPLIVDICWSNKHHSQNQIGVGDEKDTEVNGAKQTVYRENLVILDNDNRLYHVVVKGVHVRDGKQVNTQWLNNATVTCMTWKGEVLAFGYADGRISIWNLETKKFDATRLNSSMGLGPIEKLRFSTGVGGVSTGDFALIALHAGGRFTLWNALDISSPLTLYDEREETAKIVDADLLADDISPILLTSDGCLRIYDGFSEANERKMGLCMFQPSCFTLSKTAVTMLKIMLCDPLFIDVYVVPSERNLPLWSIIKRLAYPPDVDREMMIKFLKNNFNDRFTFQTLESDSLPIENVCKLLGDEWEANFWHLFQHVCCEKNCDQMTSKFDIYLGNEKFRKIQSLKLSSFDVQYCDRRQWNNHIRKLIMLNENDKAISLLLSGAGSKASAESNDGSDYYVDCLKACVLSGDQSHSENSSGCQNSRSSVLKIVATNLIADGKLYEGVELLCLGGHTVDACRYLQSFGQWFEAHFLCKLSFENSSDLKFIDLVKKWIEILLSPQVSRKTSAVYLLATIDDYEKILDILLNWKQIRLATKVVDVLQLKEENCQFWRKIQNAYAQYSRFLFDIGLRELADVYAAKSGEMSEALLKEFRILSSDD